MSFLLAIVICKEFDFRSFFKVFFLILKFQGLFMRFSFHFRYEYANMLLILMKTSVYEHNGVKALFGWFKHQRCVRLLFSPSLPS